MCAVQGNRDPATPLHETIVDFLCNTMGAHGQQVSTAHPNLSHGIHRFSGMDGYGKTDANGYGKQMQTECCYTWKVQRDSIEKN